MGRRPKAGKREAMGEKEVIEISPSPADKGKPKIKQGKKVEEKDESPLRPIFCLKNTDTDMKLIEEMEDCFILEFNPFDSIDINELSVADGGDDDGDLSVVAEKGQVACRDYPHSRHLCLQFPFDTTPHEGNCHLCYCYVCESAAPCKYWKAHCHASEQVEDWKFQRTLSRLKAEPPKS